MATRTSEQYRSLLQSLLPRGRAWTRDDDSVLGQLLYALGEEFPRVEERTEDLLYTERRVQYTDECLLDHEEDYGLPEDGFNRASTDEGRRADLYSKMLRVGQQYKSYFIDTAATLGYTITIDEFTPAWCGIFSAGDMCGAQWVLFFWRVNIDADGDKEDFDWSFDAEAFEGRAGNDIHFFINCKRSFATLMQEFNKIKPAHTIILYEFGGRAFNGAFGLSFDSIPTYDGTVVPEGFGYDFSDEFANAYSYDGTYLTGSFATDFSLAYDARFGGGIEYRGFDPSFERPS